MKSLFARTAGLVVLLTSLFVLADAPAQATVIDGPGGGQTCSQTDSHSQVSSTTIRITITTKCWGAIVGIENNVSYQRSGKYVGHKTTACTNRLLASPYSCSVTYDMSDPGGSQKFEAMNEWTIYFGRGPLCFPNGDFPDCDTARKDGVAFIPAFTS